MAEVVAEREFALNLKERREQVKMDRSALADLLEISTDRLADWENGRGLENLTLQEMSRLAETLGTSIGALAPEAENDLENGALYQLPDQRSVLKGVRGGTDYYVYHCLVRTRTAPSMVPLVVDVLVDDPKEAKFNDGHAGSEFIFVLEGEVHMMWGDPENPNETVLPTGSSLYLEPYVRHAFTATEGSGGARLLAVNF
ncbi:helix-turn-helix transcriptional regulator [Streptomonospora sp. PA3]|uniref:helix-turn-helix domain-containing protein n=1 Tax=Streptomonospora sp. PA3 TaxID=2607326 RepID=UPI0012DCC315|nr:helix-turn-helix domain-containing protein [Streptomonospora sp. PA3]MUL43182.1 helix-turn-helix transcriptional regulator [Streptomonospora sp. PA3]